MPIEIDGCRPLEAGFCRISDPEAAQSMPIKVRSTLAAIVVVILAVGLLVQISPTPASAATSVYVGSATRSANDGYWLTTAEGIISANGNARSFGDLRGVRLNQPIIAMASTPTDNGYWLVASDGGIFSFGDARFFGSTGSFRLNRPIVGMAPTPTNNGYWLVASDGGIFSFGDAAFFGSTGSYRLNQPIVGMSPTASGNGYWLVASDGGIFSFGDSAFYGSTGGIRLNQPIVGMATTSTGRGYWLAGADGGVFTFGDAEFLGSSVEVASGSRAIAIIKSRNGGYSIARSDGSLKYRPKAAPVPSPGSPAATTTTTTPPTSPTTTTAPVTTTVPPTTTTTTNPAPTGPWQLAFNDDFNTNVGEGGFLSTYRNWGAYPWGWKDTSKRGSYDPGIISVNNGVMNMRLNTTSDGVHHVAAPYPKLDTNGNINQTYGKYEVRFRADAVDGYKTAWLLWPQSETWPRDGEVDFPEGDLTGTIGAFMHRQGGVNGGDQDAYGTSARYTDWHTASVEWAPNKMVFALDGKVIGTSTSRVPNTAMHFVLQTETELGNATVPSWTSGNVQVDYVKVWKYVG